MRRKLLNITLYCFVFVLANYIQASIAQATPRFYSGTIRTNQISSACPNNEVESTYPLEFMIEETADGYRGYFVPIGEPLYLPTTVYFQGELLGNLSITYGHLGNTTTEDLTFSLKINERSLSGVLRDSHFEYSGEDCSFDELILIAKQETDEDAISNKFAPHYEAEKMFNAGVILFEDERNNDAVPFLEKSLNIFKRTLGENTQVTNMNISLLGFAYMAVGRMEDAEILLKRRLDVLEATEKPNHYVINDALESLATIYILTTRFAEAETLYKRALAMNEKTLGQRHDDTQKSLIDLASFYSYVDRLNEAEALLNRALIIADNSPDLDPSNQAIILLKLAELCTESSRYIEAEKFYERALAFTEKRFGNESPETANCLEKFASLYIKTQRFAKAETLLKRALVTNEKNESQDTQRIASNLDQLSKLYHAVGSYDKAATFLERAVTIDEKNFGQNSVEHAGNLIRLASIYLDSGRYAEAEALLNSDLFVKINGYFPEGLVSSGVYYLLGRVYSNTERFEEAVDSFLKAIASGEKFYGQDAPELAGALNSMAGLHQSAELYEEANQIYRRAVAGAIKSDNHKQLSGILLNYASLLKIQGNREAAIFFSKQALNITQSFRKAINELGTDYLKTYDQLVDHKYHFLATLLIEEGRLAEAQQVLSMLKEEEYFEFIQRDGSAINKLNARASFIAQEEPWLVEYETITSENAKLGKEVRKLREAAKLNSLSLEEQARLDQLVQEDMMNTLAFNAFLDRLVTGIKEEAQLSNDRSEDIGAKGLMSLAILKKNLKTMGEGSILLQYFITEDRVYILFTSPGDQLVRHSTISAADLNKKIFSLRDTITNTKLDPRPKAKELYDILVAPVAKALKDSKAKTLMLSLDGALRYLPFAALYDGAAYVTENYRTVMYAEAARDKVILPATGEWRVAALGLSDKVREDFPPLPNVPDELNAIVINANGGVIPGEIRLNEDFNETTLRESSQHNSVVHIASHFRFAPGTDRDSFLLLGDGSTLSLANMRDGSFFKNSELVTLSACETAIGESSKGVEFEGFGAVVMNQGAKSVIASLWSVSDKGTALLMQEFYRLKEEQKLSKGEALRQAQLALLRSDIEEKPSSSQALERGGRKRFEANPNRPYSHPYYWAPFILMGNWK